MGFTFNVYNVYVDVTSL